MSDQLEQELTALFASRAERVEVPPVPATLLAPAPPPAWRRRVAVAGLVAAAVAAVVVPVVVAGNDGRVQPAPAPTTQIPAGAAIDLPYLHRGALHAGTVTVPTRASEVVAGGGTVLVGGDGRWSRLAGDALVAVPFLDGVANVLLSPDGTTVAGTTGPDTAEAWEVASGATVLTVRRDASSGSFAEEPWLLGLDGDNRLFWQDGTSFRMRGASTPETVVRTGGELLVGVAPTGVVLRDGDSPDAELVQVLDDGSVRRPMTVPVSNAAAWGPGRTLAYVSLADGAVLVARPALGDQPSRLPVEAGSRLLGWSGDRVVVLVPDGRVLAVGPASGATEEVLSGGGETASFPGLGGTGAL